MLTEQTAQAPWAATPTATTSGRPTSQVEWQDDGAAGEGWKEGDVEHIQHPRGNRPHRLPEQHPAWREVSATEKDSTRRSFRSSSKTESYHHHAADDVPPYPQRTKRTVSSRTGATKDHASPLLFDMEEFTTLHRQTTGDGAHRRLDLQGAQQRPLQQAFLPGGCCVDKRPVAKQRCGSEDSIYCNTRTTVAKTPGDGPGTTAQADPTTTDNHHPTHVPVLSSPTEENLGRECAQLLDRFTCDNIEITTRYTGHWRRLCWRDGLPSEGSCRARYRQCWQCNPLHSTSCQRRRASTMKIQHRTATPWRPEADTKTLQRRCRRNHFPAEAADAWGNDQTFCQAADRPVGSSSPLVTLGKSRRITRLNCKACRSKTRLSCKPHARDEARPKQVRVTDSFSRVGTNVHEKRAGRAKNGLHDS